MSWWLRAKVNASSVISRVKCLAILNLLITLPTRSAILSRPRSGRLSRRGGGGMFVSPGWGGGGWGCGDLVQLGGGGGQQLVAFAGPLGCEGRVAAAHQPLAGIVR